MLDFYRWHVSSFLRLTWWQQCLTWLSLTSQEVERHCWDFYEMILQPFWLLPGITNLVEISDGFRWCVVFSSTHPDLDLHMCGRQSKLFPSSNHLGGFSFQVKNLNRGQLHERKVIKALDLFPSSVPPGWPVRWPRIRTSIEVNKPHVDFKWEHLMSIEHSMRFRPQLRNKFKISLFKISCAKFLFLFKWVHWSVLLLKSGLMAH